MLPKLSKSIKTKLVVLSLIILSVPLLTLGVFSYTNISKSLENLGKTNVKNIVKLTIELIEEMQEQVELGIIPLQTAEEMVKQFILGEKNADGSRDMSNQVDLGEYGYLYIFDQDGNFIAHPFLEGTNVYDNNNEEDIRNAESLIAAGEKGGDFVYFDYKLPNDDTRIEKKINYAETDPFWGWTIIAGTYLLDFNKPAKNLVHVISIVSAIMLVLGSMSILKFTNSITKPIQKVTGRLTQLSQGDLTGETLLVDSENEIGVMTEAMNQLQEKLKQIISEISQSAEVISTSSEELTQSAEEVQTSSEQIMATMEELASGAENQAHSSSRLSQTMSSFSLNASEAREHGENVKQTSEETLILTNKGTELMTSSSNQMEKIDEVIRDSYNKVQNLQNQSRDITKFVSIINEIARNTNLLSLNASIEAARAGEHGKGFAVVAEEVRKLAEQSAASVGEISKIVEIIQKEINKVSDSLNLGYREVQQGTNQIHQTHETFNRINSSISKMVVEIERISDGLKFMDNKAIEMNSAVQEVAAIAQESAAGIEETSASSHQTTTSMQEVSKRAKQLSNLAENLNQLVQVFKM